MKSIAKASYKSYSPKIYKALLRTLLDVKFNINPIKHNKHSCTIQLIICVYAHSYIIIIIQYQHGALSPLVSRLSVHVSDDRRCQQAHTWYYVLSAAWSRGCWIIVFVARLPGCPVIVHNVITSTNIDIFAIIGFDWSSADIGTRTTVILIIANNWMIEYYYKKL